MGGVFLIFVALRDVFQAVIVPRAVTTTLRFSRYLARTAWFLWPRIGNRLFANNPELREDFFGTYAPMYFVTLLILWVVALLIGWGLIFYGLRAGLRPHHLHLGDTIYFAGTSLLTIGYGDIVPVTFATRMLALFCGASGLGVVAVVISFIFSIFGAFQNREQFVVTISARAGNPPSGLGLLEVHALLQLQGDLGSIFREAQNWAAAVMETHLAYPTLIYFRSSHDNQSWVGTLGTLLDAAALVITTISEEDLPEGLRGQASVLLALGQHLTQDFSNYFSFMDRPDEGPGVELSEFTAAAQRLQQAGYRTRDMGAAWKQFSQLRAGYGPHLNALARWLEIPPLQWIGDRSLLRTTH